MVFSQWAYDRLEDIQSMEYLDDCKVMDYMRDLRVEFYNKLGKYVNEKILMEIGNSLLQDWKEDQDNCSCLSEKLYLEEAHWRALNEDFSWIKQYLIEKDRDRNRDDDSYDSDW